jgi:hypothetical protein
MIFGGVVTCFSIFTWSDSSTMRSYLDGHSFLFVVVVVVVAVAVVSFP